MSHLEDRLAEFIYEELTVSEMEEAKKHVAQCLECQGRVSEFQRIQSTLETVSDVEVPQRVFFVESRKPSLAKMKLPVRWLAPLAIAAGLVVAIVLTGPIHFDKQGSGLTIAFGTLPAPTPLPVASQPIVADPVTIDYEQIVATVAAQQQAWLESELTDRIQSIAAVNGSEIQRLRGEIAYLFDVQRASLRDTLENTSSIQLLAARTEVRE